MTEVSFVGGTPRVVFPVWGAGVTGLETGRLTSVVVFFDIGGGLLATNIILGLVSFLPAMDWPTVLFSLKASGGILTSTVSFSGSVVALVKAASTTAAFSSVPCANSRAVESLCAKDSFTASAFPGAAMTAMLTSSPSDMFVCTRVPVGTVELEVDDSATLPTLGVAVIVAIVP